MCIIYGYDDYIPWHNNCVYNEHKNCGYTLYMAKYELGFTNNAKSQIDHLLSTTNSVIYFK